MITMILQALDGLLYLFPHSVHILDVDIFFTKEVVIYHIVHMCIECCLIFERCVLHLW